ncbi:transposase [Streptomyces sp. NPDC050619]|uniref:transposase n=1 Tax=Streptomyces sp. NPDC050619 TaxID=3157214 RepID=UPI00341E164D
MILWPLARRYLPSPVVRPQGGGTQRVDEEAVFAAILYVLVSREPWRALPRTFSVSWQNAHRRFAQWSEAGLWDRIRESCGGPHTPGAVQQWADAVAALAEERLRRGGLPPAVVPVPPPPGRGKRLNPVIRVHDGGDFTARLFGSAPALRRIETKPDIGRP